MRGSVNMKSNAHPLVFKALRKYDGSIWDLAHVLGVPRETVWRWVKKGVQPNHLARRRLREILKQKADVA